ncbi:MAG: outer membrane protein assembly factor BamA [Bacteroidales bacterium]|nr:outer membrane protein assembly factor BamA [Bacteroidales bacterium]
MHYRIISILICFFYFTSGALGQELENQQALKEDTPVILYTGKPKKYEIADIQVEGVPNYEDYVLIGLSGLSVGQTISIPGDDITQAIKRYWRHGLFSDVKITAEKIVEDKIYLKISLTQRPRISDIHYYGVKKSERTDLEAQLGLVKGGQVTPNLINRAKTIIERYFDDKGFKNADVMILQKDDLEKENQIFLEVNIDKKAKIKVRKIHIAGNEALSDLKIKKTIKKTNEVGRVRNWFKTKKFVSENYEADKEHIIEKYNELGFRDATILKDSVELVSENRVDVHLDIEEGDKYYLRNVHWIGNTLFPSEYLNELLQMKKGDVYNQKLLTERTLTDDDAIGNLYYNNGYLFYNLDPVEVNIVGDSIDLEMRIFEGRQATINKVKINGNDRLYENVVRRELRTRPGELFSKDDLMRSMREIQQMGHFDPENIHPDINPDPVNGTVDIAFELESKANDQVEFSAGWGQTGVIGKLSLRFTNFSLPNLFKKNENYRGILPQGDGQTLTISGQTNAKYFQSYSISFFDPWFGGKRPNSFSLSMFYSKQTDISSRYYNDAYIQNLQNMYYGGYYGGAGMYNYGSYTSFENYYDPDKSMKMFGIAAGWGKRLNWPDDYFTLSAELSYQRYILKDWMYFPVTDGNSNNISLNITLARSSIDNPLYPRSGSEFSLSAQLTPPYSLFEDKDYSKYDPKKLEDMNRMHKWIEYHKWKFKSKTYTPLVDPFRYKRTPVLMTRVEFGLLGHYNKYKKSPFETFDMGGDGMTGYSTYATESIALRGYENSSLTPYGNEGYAYTRLGVELRYPVLLEPSSTIYILGFLEAGNAWNNIKDFDPFDLKRSAGLGVRIFLPMIGMMGIDWAYGFDKVFGSKEYGGSQIHFILGQEF